MGLARTGNKGAGGHTDGPGGRSGWTPIPGVSGRAVFSEGEGDPGRMSVVALRGAMVGVSLWARETDRGCAIEPTGGHPSDEGRHVGRGRGVRAWPGLRRRTDISDRRSTGAWRASVTGPGSTHGSCTERSTALASRAGPFHGWGVYGDVWRGTHRAARVRYARLEVCSGMFDKQAAEAIRRCVSPRSARVDEAHAWPGGWLVRRETAGRREHVERCPRG